MPGLCRARCGAFSFRRYLLDGPDENSTERRLNYFTIGENVWHSADTWPPKGLTTIQYYLGADHTLRAQAITGELMENLPVISTGETNRWSSQVTGGNISYSGVMDKFVALPSFTSATLKAATEITGQPVLRLHLSAEAAHARVMAYLTVVDPEGKGYYLTEGYLRLELRKTDASQQTLHSYLQGDTENVPQGKEFEADLALFPISVVVPKGYRLRLSLASGDSPQFGASTAFQATMFTSSQLELPAKQRSEHYLPSAKERALFTFGTLIPMMMRPVPTTANKRRPNQVGILGLSLRWIIACAARKSFARHSIWALHGSQHYGVMKSPTPSFDAGMFVAEVD